jgi:hypothetical protein
MTIGLRQVRGVGLIGAALIAIVAVSFVYLRPAPTKAVAVPPVARQAGGTVHYQFTLTGQANGGYFYWTRKTGSGGHGT